MHIGSHCFNESRHRGSLAAPHKDVYAETVHPEQFTSFLEFETSYLVLCPRNFSVHPSFTYLATQLGTLPQIVS